MEQKNFNNQQNFTRHKKLFKCSGGLFYVYIQVPSTKQRRGWEKTRKLFKPNIQPRIWNLSKQSFHLIIQLAWPVGNMKWNLCSDWPDWPFILHTKIWRGIANFTIGQLFQKQHSQQAEDSKNKKHQTFLSSLCYKKARYCLCQFIKMPKEKEFRQYPAILTPCLVITAHLLQTLYSYL